MRESLFTIGPHAPFLDTLADRILDGALLGGWDVAGPFGLADVTIFLPSRRARLALIDRFLARSSCDAALLPAIRTLGEEDEETAALFDDETPGLDAVDPVSRQLVLARLIEAWVAAEERGGASGFASPPSPAEIVALAGSLGRLIDDFEIEEVAPERLREVVPETLAENWQTTLEFLEVVLDAWPGHLQESGKADVSRLRRRRLEREAASLTQRYADRPVIAAGSTGSIKATARLIAGIADLPRGVVVLPGLDTSLDGDLLRGLNTDAHRHAHPQYGLANLLNRLRRTPRDVPDLAGEATPRVRAVRTALALAEGTAAWGDSRAALGDAAIAKATGDLTLVAATTQHEEARAISVAAHDALRRGETVGIISPDRGLARRIAHELERFGISIEDTAGVPLAQSRAARLLRQALLVVSGGWAPVDLVALLAARPVMLGLGRAQIGRRTSLLELAALRGQRPRDGLAGIRGRLEANRNGDTDHPLHTLTDAEFADVAELLDALETALAPLSALVKVPSVALAGLAPAATAALDALRQPPPDEDQPSLEGEVELAAWLAILHEARAPEIAPTDLAAGLVELMAGLKVPPAHPARTDIAIWGRIEARLQSADLMIAAGLNEAIWPGPADPGPWMNRSMRLAAGLEPPERRIGLAAHDFETALGAGRVLLTYSRRIGTSPADPSRFVQRFCAFVGEAPTEAMTERGGEWRHLAIALDHVEAPASLPRPRPKPPADIRPRRLSVTEIETLIRDPYAIYARHVLGLKKLDPLGEAPDAATRGGVIHDILGRFIDEGGDPLKPSAFAELEAMADQAFAEFGDIADRALLWRTRSSAIAAAFLDWERARAGRIATRHAEISGAAEFEIAGEAFTLHGRADRIDELTAGGLEIVDFKTGGVPGGRQMAERLAPQLPMEAVIARAGGFVSVPAAEAVAMGYVKFAHGPNTKDETDFAIKGLDLSEAVDSYWALVQNHIALMLLKGDHPMHSHLMPETGIRYERDFDHLARVSEWSIGEGDGQ